MQSTLYIVIPCYNEEDVLPITAPLFLEELQKLQRVNLVSDSSRILFVNDGSKDRTWEIIKDLSKDNELYCGISLSRNRGHQNALLCGLMEAKDCADVTVSIDCDGQDDIHAIKEMVEAYHNGFEVVYGVRSNRDSDSFMKKFTAELFYKLLKGMGAEVIFNHADYRLISSRVLAEFSNFKEVNLFLRGLIPLVGFESTTVYYVRNERLAGESHYPLRKMLSLAFDGITSLSIKPIRLITTFGIFVSFLSFLMVVYSFIRFFSGNTVAGWASTSSIICFLCGVQIISLGVIGEYIGRIYLETKARPRYIVSERTTDRNND